jgi:imidazole glycerol phosphate synthase glutamine amidotransferase subunit
VIGIVDYGMGNLGSVEHALSALSAPFRRVAAPADLPSCDALVLPGVGAFGDCMANLSRAALVAPLRDWIAADRPFLGICLGLQALCEASEEAPGVAGLGVVPVRCLRFDPPPEAHLKVPQIGWNRVEYDEKSPLPILTGIPSGTYFYFVHSYHLPSAPGFAVATARYPSPYAAAIQRSRVAAVQFHPEKSQAAGLRLLLNFLSLS